MIRKSGSRFSIATNAERVCTEIMLKQRELEQRRLLDLLDAKVGVDGAYGLHTAPFFAVARDRKQIIRCGRIVPVRQRRRRRHADRGDLAVGAFEPHRRMDVVVAVQDQFDATPLQHRA